MNRVTYKDLKEAIESASIESRTDIDDPDDIAELVINLFGFDKTITDNLLSPRERDIFYKLEDLDILFTEEETTSLPSGKKWRIHYWVLNENKIKELLENKNGEKEKERTEEKSIYNDLSDEIWERGST